MKQSGMYKKKRKERTTQDLLMPKPPSSISTRGNVIKIAPNICIDKRMCQKCGRGGNYGIPLQFILHFSKGGVETVCYRCGAKVAEKEGFKLPSTEEDIFAALNAPNSRIIQRGFKKMEENHEQKNV
jgi:hypothetical protein